MIGDTGDAVPPTRSSGRRLAAIVFADVAGYTELSSRDEDLALRVIDAFQRMSRAVITNHAGRVVKFLGDGMLAEFVSLDSAVAASQGLQAAFTAMDESKEADVALRVGVHLGDVVFSEDGDVYGSGVNVASRIESHAPLSGIVVSDSAYRHLRNRKAYKFSSIGEHELKGVPDPMELYVVLLQDQQPAAPAVRVIAPEPTGLAAHTSPAWAFARWAVATVLTVALAAYAADVPGVRGATVRLASVVGLGSVVGPTSVEPPSYAAVEGGAVVEGPVTLRFTGPIDPATATRSSIQLLGPEDEAVPIRVGVGADGMAVDLVPRTPLLYGTPYRIVITSLLRSVHGTAIELPEGTTPLHERLGFVTQPVPPGAPLVVSSTPSDRATDVDGDAELTFVFDQAMEPASFGAETVSLLDSDERTVPSSLSCCGEDGTRLAVHPASPLRPGPYTLHLHHGLADQDGEYLAARVIGFEVSEVVAPRPPPSGPGRLAIIVVPSELGSRTTVYLDGEPIGSAPVSPRSVQESVRHRIEIFAVGDYSQNRLSIYDDEVILSPGQSRTVEARVTPFGDVSIVSDPVGVVYIDGQEIGSTPLVSHLVTANRPHRLEVRPTGATAATHRAYVAEFTVGLLESAGLGRVQLPPR
jgi:class 3 adenylate cyclase